MYKLEELKNIGNLRVKYILILEYLQCLCSECITDLGFNLLINLGAVFVLLASVSSVASLSSHVSSAVEAFDSLHSDGKSLGVTSCEGSEADLVSISCSK